MSKAAVKMATETLLTPPSLIEGEVLDRRSQFTKLTRSAPEERDAQTAKNVFIASKIAMLRSHPGLREQERVSIEADFAQLMGVSSLEALSATKKTGPVPGGVGYGPFYTAAFRTAFARGTSLYYEIACPTPPGGNVSTYLYLTATNRAQKGVEAFVSYQGQNDTRFKVFDWARPDQWQTNIPFANLANYCSRVVAHGKSLQILKVQNSTFEIAPNRWRNEVLMHNRVANRWDLIYRFDYASTTAIQTAGWVGSWGPIVETFQPTYNGTNLMGFLNTMLIGRNAAGVWGAWGLLTGSQSTIRNDGLGFSPAFLDANYSFVVKS